jgi:iron complex outermembrane receptor protein
MPVRGGGEQYNLSASYGIALGTRGHASISASYNKVSELERGDRSFLGCEEENVTNVAGERVDPTDPRTGKPYCGLFIDNQIQLFGFGANNLVGPCVPAIPGTGGTTGCPAGQVRRAIGSVQFDPTLAQYLSTPAQVGTFFAGRTGAPLNSRSVRVPAGFFPTGSFTADALALGNNYDQRVDNDSIIPGTKRFTVYGEAGYDITDDVNLYFEGLYNRRKTKTDGSRQLFFFQYPNCLVNTAPCPTGAQYDPLNTGFTGYSYLRPVIYAPASSSTDVKYFRGLAGVHATLDKLLPHGFADFYFQHSRSDGDYNRDVIFRDAIEFGVAEFRRDLCAGTVTAIRGVPCLDINYTDPRVLRGDFTPQERAFLFGVDHGNTLYTQNTGELSFGGDLFKLPGGAVKFALGTQWRRDMINDVPGEASLTGNSWQSTSAGITAGHETTTEGFGEVEIPLLKDIPMIREFTLNGAARYTTTKAVRKSDGLSDTDKAWTYKAAANWVPVSPLRLRATYGTSFRSPALFEQFLADESSFADPGADPCQRYELSENQEIQTNCAAQGIPEGFLPTQSIRTFAGGGIGVLNPEKSRALTLSAIFTPDGWLWRDGQFSFAVDYINIKVRKEVTQLGPTNILNGCYTSDSFPDDPLCSLFVRAPAGAPNEFEITDLHDPYLNIDTEQNKALDFTMRYRQRLGSLGTISFLGQMTYQLKDKFELFQGVVQDFNGEAGDPKWTADFNLTWIKAPWTVTYGLQVIAGTNDIRNLRDVGGTQLTADNCLATASAFALRGGPYCPVYKLPRVAYRSSFRRPRISACWWACRISSTRSHHSFRPWVLPSPRSVRWRRSEVTTITSAAASL